MVVTIPPKAAPGKQVRGNVSSVWIFLATMARLRTLSEETGVKIYRLADLLINEALDKRAKEAAERAGVGRSEGVGSQVAGGRPA